MNPEENKAPDPEKDLSKDSSTEGQRPGYGYGYGRGYGYGYGYNKGYNNYSGYGSGELGIGDVVSNIAETIQTRTAADYITIFRERIWYLILAIFVIVAGTFIYTYNIVPEYTATARVRVLRGTIESSMGRSFSTDQISSNEDLMTQIEIMKSEQIISNVQKRLSSQELSEVIDPYRGGSIFSGPLSPTEVIERAREIRSQRQTLVVIISYTHRNREVARKMADYFVDEIKKRNLEDRSEISNPVLESTRTQIITREKEIDEMRARRAAIIKEEGLLTVDMGTVAQELSSINATRDQEHKNYEDMLVIYNGIKKAESEKRSLVTQPAIANNTLVASLLSRVTDLRIAITGMLEKYGENHPSLVQSTQQLEQAEAELSEAVKKAKAEFESNFLASKRRYESAQRRAQEKLAMLERLRESDIQRQELDSRIKITEELLQNSRINLENMKMRLSGMSSTLITILDRATVPPIPSNKNFAMNALFGFVAGVVVGSGIILLLSLWDDRIKSLKDIESSLGFSLLTSVARIARRTAKERAMIVATGKERSITESFIALYSALKIGDESKNAKMIAVTSTTPSEGKSFVSTNLGMTYANHGEKTLIVDGDLRLPNVGASLQIDEKEKGLTHYISGESSLDDAIVKDFVPNCDILPVGSYCKNPTQIINSQKFVDMIEEFKKRYDRIIIDTPPIGAVSDVLNLLPLCDGVVYTIKFNSVQRLMVKSNLKRLEEAKVPVFGIVLNQMSRHTGHRYVYSGHYGAYAKYYGKSKAEEVKVEIKD